MLWHRATVFVFFHSPLYLPLRTYIGTRAACQSLAVCEHMNVYMCMHADLCVQSHMHAFRQACISICASTWRQMENGVIARERSLCTHTRPHLQQTHACAPSQETPRPQAHTLTLTHTHSLSHETHTNEDDVLSVRRPAQFQIPRSVKRRVTEHGETQLYTHDILIIFTPMHAHIHPLTHTIRAHIRTYTYMNTQAHRHTGTRVYKLRVRIQYTYIHVIRSHLVWNMKERGTISVLWIRIIPGYPRSPDPT